MKTLPSGILFDHDGVLVASEPIHWAAWGRLMDELGLPYDEAKVRGMVGQTAPQILEILLNTYMPDWGGDPARLTELVQRKNDLYMEEAQKGLQPYPGVREGLQWMKSQGIQAAVVSNARRRELNKILEDLGLAPYFDIILSREDVTAFKPDPIPYLTAAEHLGLLPEQCVAVEDSPPGIESALLAQVPAAAVLTNFPREVMQHPVPGRPDLQPFWIGPSMVEFFKMIQRLKP